MLVTHTDVLQPVDDAFPPRILVDEVFDVSTHIRKGCSRGVVVNTRPPRANQRLFVSQHVF